MIISHWRDSTSRLWKRIRTCSITPPTTRKGTYDILRIIRNVTMRLTITSRRLIWFLFLSNDSNKKIIIWFLNLLYLYLIGYVVIFFEPVCIV